uniref:Uncharacterized protein n=1 Tax=Setaria digitata TaxID=48799 RepID=A0A915PY44_9BILA
MIVDGENKFADIGDAELNRTAKEVAPDDEDLIGSGGNRR